MGTTTGNLLERHPRRKLRTEIARQRDRLIDLDLVVDDHRHVVDCAVEELRGVVGERDRTAHYLSYLVDLHDEIEAVAEQFGPEIANQYAADIWVTPASR